MTAVSIARIMNWKNASTCVYFIMLQKSNSFSKPHEWLIMIAIASYLYDLPWLLRKENQKRIMPQGKSQ